MNDVICGDFRDYSLPKGLTITDPPYNQGYSYNEYKDKGFTVFSVSLDKDINRWLSAIKQDNLYWPNHVSDLKQWQSEAVKIYGFTGIPFTVLIDKEGEIIAKNLRGVALDKKIKELLGD